MNNARTHRMTVAHRALFGAGNVVVVVRLAVIGQAVGVSFS